MLVWVASFPRSGNTFLRMVLHRRYGIGTAVIYDVDGVAARLGSDLVGFRERVHSLHAMRADTGLHFVKTHRQRDGNIAADDPGICLVRDGRDALVSWARQVSERPGRDFRTELAATIDRDTPVGTGSWGRNVLSWLDPPAPNRALLRYENLLRDPTGTVEQILTRLDLPVPAVRGVAVPTFAVLHALDPAFFRRGHTGTHRDEMPDDLHQRFWARPDNTTAMTVLGYRHEPSRLGTS